MDLKVLDAVVVEVEEEGEEAAGEEGEVVVVGEVHLHILYIPVFKMRVDDEKI